MIAHGFLLVVTLLACGTSIIETDGWSLPHRLTIPMSKVNQELVIGYRPHTAFT